MPLPLPARTASAGQGWSAVESRSRLNGTDGAHSRSGGYHGAAQRRLAANRVATLSGLTAPLSAIRTNAAECAPRMVTIPNDAAPEPGSVTRCPGRVAAAAPATASSCDAVSCRAALSFGNSRLTADPSCTATSVRVRSGPDTVQSTPAPFALASVELVSADTGAAVPSSAW